MTWAWLRIEDIKSLNTLCPFEILTKVFEIAVNMRKQSNSTKSKAGYLKTNIQRTEGRGNRIEQMEGEEKDERKGKG